MKRWILLLVVGFSQAYAFVEHKDEYIETYLSNISQNMQEKTEIIEHIKANIDGTFLDIGTGGDAISVIVQDLPHTSRPTLIAADIDPMVINSIKMRRPEIMQYINGSKGPKVELVTMSATNMAPIKDSSIAGIGASALAHEVFSYTPNRGPLDQFVAELCRVLEKEGVFIYRDPRWVEDPQSRCIMIVKEELAKYYTTLFLSKFLDRTYTRLRDYRDECCKPMIYSNEDVRVNAYKLNSDTFSQMSFDEFLNTPSHCIDYKRNFSIEAPRGLIAEIERHYLMFLNNNFAAGFVESRLFADDLNLNDLSREERKVLVAFAERNRIEIPGNIIRKQDVPTWFKEATKLKQLFREGFRFPIAGNKAFLDYIQSLHSQGLNRNLFYLIDDQTLVIDPKILVVLFQGQGKGIFQFIECSDAIPSDLLEHLKLEGEEHYFYKTTAEMITYVGQFSRYVLRDTHKKGYILAPIDLDHIKTAPRDFYKATLERDMLVMDKHGAILRPVTEKNIIHFRLQPEQRAIEVYKQIVASNPEGYGCLQKWVTRLEKKDF